MRCLGVISRLSQTKRRLEPSRSRSSGASRSGSTAVSSSTASSTSMIRLRLGEQRGRAHVGRQDLAVAVEDVGPRGRDRVLHHGAPPHVALGHRREHDQPPGDDRIAEPEHQDGEPEPRPGLGGAIDIAAVEQRAHERAAPGSLHRRAGARNRHGIGCVDRGHLAVLGCWDARRSARPAGCRSDRTSSGGTRSGGRSGRRSSWSNWWESIGPQGRDAAAPIPGCGPDCRAWTTPRAAPRWRRARA